MSNIKVIPQIMKNIGLITLIFCLTLLVSLTVQAQSSGIVDDEVKPLRLGLLPHLNTRITINKYSSLITYLQNELKRPIVFTTAPDFKTYLKRAEQGDFDLYLTAPNIAAYHEKHNKHLRVAKFTEKLQGVFVVAEDSPYYSLEELRSKTMATPDVMAVITSLGEITLLENGIDPGKDIHLLHTESHNNSLQSVVRGKADAAILGYPAYNVITSRAKLTKPVRILAKTKVIPHLMFMCPPTVTIQELEKFKSILLKFSDSDEGKKFFAGLPFVDLAVITDDDMLRVAGLLKLLEQRLTK